MPSVPGAPVGVGEAAIDIDIPGPSSRGRGRTRYCKKCKFSCTDAREFTAHQAAHQIAHQAAHSDSGGDITTDTDLAQTSAINNSNNNNNNSLSNRRILRPKRSSKTSNSESSAMEPKDNVDSSAPVDDATDINMESLPNDRNHGESAVKKAKMINSAEDSVSLLEEEDGGDEPDAMAIKPQKATGQVNHNNNDTSKLPNGNIDGDSGDEDMDDEDRLVIDDENLSRQIGRYSSVQNHTYRCQQCDLVTTDAKLYLQHLRHEHNTDANIYDCDICDFSTTSSQRFSSHRKEHFLNGNIAALSSEKEKDAEHQQLNDSSNFMNIPSSTSSRPNSAIDDIDDEMDGSETPPMGASGGVAMAITAENIDQVLDEDKKKKKKTRQEVDPGKYFEAVDSSGTKYACSQCGNIYKWRKSLNKHWKEKHSTDPLVEMASPPGMVELLKSGKYTQLGARRIYDNAFLSTIKTNKDEEPSHPSLSPHETGQSPSPPNFLTNSQSLTSAASRLASMMPKMIGPFVANTAQPVFPGMPLPLHPISLTNGYDSPEESALDLTRDSKPESRASPYSVTGSQDYNSFDQEQPLDFSRKKDPSVPVQVKIEQWDVPTHSANQLLPKVHRCSKCDYASNSEMDFANHMSSHLGKRLVKCHECNIQIPSMDELNSHFIQFHGRKLTEYKEAIKKIPHGLQQTYHLLKMDLNDISELGNQDLGASEGKSLKCKKCDFEAKWPAELQKHAVSHSEERPYICMVCGSTYKWKWDLVKHFQKSHPNLPNPYRRNDKRDTPDGSSEDDEDDDDKPDAKRPKLEGMNGGNMYNRDDNISVEGIIAATQAGQRLISSQPNILDDEPSLERNIAFLQALPFAVNGDSTSAQVAQIAQAAQAAQDAIDRRNKAQKALQDAVRNRQNGKDSVGSSASKKNGSKGDSSSSSSPSQGSSKEVLPYKCPMCNYHARWPSEVTQHMKNHSDCKPYLCPRCDYRSKWKWDVVKHMRRCGGGGINDVIDTTKIKKKDMAISNGPPNAVVGQQGKVRRTTPQPSGSYAGPTIDQNMVMRVALAAVANMREARANSDALMVNEPGFSSSNNNDTSAPDNNTNNNYRAYADGLTVPRAQSSTSTTPVTAMEETGHSNSPAPSPAQQPTTTSTRQNSSGEVWKCPHCAFRTQSQAELKRHSGLHSDDKPFKCDVCQYSTRWACDLKKHRKSYNHYPNQDTTTSAKENDINGRGRFKCTRCSLYFHTLHGLLEHRVAEHIGRDSNQSSPAPQNDQNEIDAARIKHPRKPIKQIQCLKCPFVCKSRQTMDKHMEEHEQLEMSGLQCFYCNAQFKDKEALLDHITVHSAFNPKEWETFFMVSEEEELQQQAKENGDTPASTDTDITPGFSTAEQHKTSEINDKHSKDSTEARIQQILNEVHKVPSTSQQQQQQQQPLTHNKYKCEWCPAEFVNLTAVYKHARQAHPIQLQEQDNMANSGQSQTALSPTNPSPSKKHYTGDPIEILRQQIAEKRHQHQADKQIDLHNHSSKTQETLGVKTENFDNNQFRCDKCSFSTPNYITFQRHCELHGSKLTSQCWFCDYSVDRMELLYQHMKISHTRKWKALSQDPKYAEQIQKMNQAFSNSAAYGNNNDSPPEHIPDVMDLSSRPKQAESKQDIMYITKQQYTWSGIPVNVIPVGSALNFVCPHCAFSDASLTKTCAHVIQSHRAMTKFTCRKCQFYDDNMDVMTDHCRTYHPAHERVVEVLDFKPLNFNELQMVQLSAMREKVSQDLSKNVAQSTDEKSEKKVAIKPMACPFCPFKTAGTEEMKSHLQDHSRPARYRCQVCDFNSDSKSVITEHVKVHDTDDLADIKAVLEAVNTQVKAKKEAASKGTADFDMKLSGRSQAIVESELNHSIQQGSPRSRLNKRIRYRCSACPFQNLCRTNIMKHRKQHNNSKKYQCPKCTYGAARAVLLKKHLDSHNSPVEDDGQYHDIFIDPNGPDPEEIFKTEEADEPENEVVEADAEEFDEDDANSDLDEMDAKAIADLEAKDILEAEAAHKATIILDDDANPDNLDKQFRKQKCPHCPFSSNSGYEFRKHLNFHGTQERYKCDRCSYSLDRLNLLSQHRKLHADEPGFNPNVETSSLLNTQFILQQNSNTEDMEAETEEVKMDSVQEEKSSSVDSQFSCTFCPYKCTNKKSLDIHCNSHGLRKRFICDFCDWSADRSALLFQHRKVHMSEPKFIDAQEEKGFLNHEFDDGASGEFEAKFMEIKNSDKTVKEGEAESTASPPFKLTVVKKSYPCKLCPYKTNSKTSFSFHKNMHSSGAEFKCTECSYAASNAGLLQQHLQLHSSPELLSPTSSTAKSPAFNQQLSEEDVTTQGEDLSLNSKKKESPTQPVLSDEPINQELKCERCPFTAATPALLREHVRGHNSQESLACPYCDFSAMSEQVMFPHVQIHFPGTKLEPEALQRIVEEHNKTLKNNTHKDGAVSHSPEKEATLPTRVYVCQYCEREFEVKDLMIQHEKQHLVGSH